MHGERCPPAIIHACPFLSTSARTAERNLRRSGYRPEQPTNRAAQVVAVRAVPCSSRCSRQPARKSRALTAAVAVAPLRGAAVISWSAACSSSSKTTIAALGEALERVVCTHDWAGLARICAQAALHLFRACYSVGYLGRRHRGSGAFEFVLLERNTLSPQVSTCQYSAVAYKSPVSLRALRQSCKNA